MGVKRYMRIWRRYVVLNISILAASRLDFLTFVPGKLLRMGFFFILPVTLLQFSPTIGGYGAGEVLMFFAMMNLIDVLTQIVFFRGLNLMPYVINRGEFDQVLSKPISPLFWTMFRVIDVFDLLTLPGAVLYVGYAWTQLAAVPTLGDVLLWVGFTLLAVVLAFAVVLSVVAINFWTTETDNAAYLYRDALNISRFPPTVFPRWAQAVLFSVMPALVIVSVPVHALIGEMSWPLALFSIGIVVVWLILALALWRLGLQHYSSASS